jgi:hypothetical protein
MNKVETIEEFYKRKFNWIPDNFRNEIGHFNVFKLEPFVPGKPTSIPYKRRDFYKIMLVIGNSQVHYADKVVEVQKQALSFSNPQIPYKWEHLDTIRSGVYCIFDQYFFHQYGNLSQYALFQPDGDHIFELTDEQVDAVNAIYQRMFTEINSDYIHKYDVLRTLVFELVHFALKMLPSAKFEKHAGHASQRIATLFLELLERQFPIDDNHQSVNFRSASDFAKTTECSCQSLKQGCKRYNGKNDLSTHCRTYFTGSKNFIETQRMECFGDCLC